MTISTVTNEQLRERIEIYAREQVDGKTPEKREIAAFYAAVFTELLAVREAQSVPVAYRYRYNGKHLASVGCSDMVSSWKYCEEVGLVNPDERYDHQALFTAPHAQVVPQSDHLKRALKLAGEAKELADRIRAEEQMLPAVLGEQLINIANHIAGSEGGLPDEWKDWASELVSDLRRLAKSKAVPVVPGDAEFNAWVQRDYNREVTLSCPVNLGIAKSAWQGCCTAILEGQKG